MKPPFMMKASRCAVLIGDGRFVISGRASFVWETFLMRRGAGVPGHYQIRRGEKDSPWHTITMSIEEAEQALAAWGTFGARRVRQARLTRANRVRQGLKVA